MKEGELYQSKYKILKVYKETSEGCVLLAEHVQLNSYWIIKQLNDINTETMREVEVLKGVSNSGIPMIIDVITDDKSLIIIREFVEGDNLNEYSKNGLSQDEIVDIGLKVCKILRYLHEELAMPLIFRDIKPGNIIITKKGELKLIDFGIARFYKEESSHDTTYLGTKGFASPEQYGLFQSDVRTDVFGLGATLYYLITKKDLGKPPYKILPISQFRSDVDKSLEVILNKACEINKNKRFQTIREFETELNKLVKVEGKISWQEKVMTSNLETLMFTGLKPGGGTTYSVMRVAKYLSERHISTLIIDHSSNSDLLSLEFQEEGSSSKRYVDYKGVKIITARQLGELSTIISQKMLENIQVIIIDYGSFTYEDNLRIVDSLEGYEKLTTYVVSKISPWEIELFEEFVLSDNHMSSLNIIINSCSIERFKTIQKSLDEISLIFQPFIPFEDLRTEDKFCENLLMEMEVCKECPKKQSFLSPSYVKTKLLKRVKS